MTKKKTTALIGTFLATIGGVILVVIAAAQKPEPFQEVLFDTLDQGRIYANLYGDGEHGVVLAHGAIFDKESWDPLARRLLHEGHRVVAIDFRGYGKSTEGTESGALYLDVLGAVEYLQKAGAKRVSIVGGSMGGGAVAEAAVHCQPGDVDRVILLAGVPSETPQRMQGKKLFIVSEGDGLRRTIEQQFKDAPQPKKLVVLPGDAHAQHIFKTKQAGDLTRIIVDWLSDGK